MIEKIVQMEQIPLETPVLFLIFNRPDLTEKVFGQIRKVRPKQLFIAADGPRASHPDDLEKCLKTREIVLGMIDWDCEVNTLFRDTNLGCGLAVSQAITWFFEHVEMGIILEDDCYPDLSFFRFCEELLEYYKDDERVMHISGGSYLPKKYFSDNSYYFSKYAFVWGWATWRSSWEKFYYDVTGLNLFINKIHKDKKERIYWERTYHSIISGNLDTWAWRWNFILWENNGFAVNAVSNWIKNIGFQNDSTHTRTEIWAYKQVRIEKTEFNWLNHPNKMQIYEKADNLVFKYYNLRERKLIDRINGRLQSIFMGKKKR